MGIFDSIFGGGTSVDLKEEVAKGAKIIDVRSPGEFAGGHAKGAVNIPLDQIPNNVEKLRKMDATLIMCCASGMRSGNATSFLKKQGFENVHNAGPWTNLA